MNKLLKDLTSTNEHRVSVLQLYRELLRKTNKLHQNQLPSSINQYELQFSIKESFHKRYGSTHDITIQLLKGIRLNEILELNQWNDLEELIKEERRLFFEYQKRRASYLKNKVNIHEKQINNLRGKAKSQILSLKKGKLKYQKPDLSTANGKSQFLKDGLKESKFHGSLILQRFIHELQLLNKLPESKLLPYTPERIFTTGDNLDSRHIVGGVTNHALSHYDQDILQSIIIPGLEYEINKNYLDELRTILQEKGPYEAVIKETNSGIVPLPYIMQPTKHKIGREELAVLVKRQTFCLRMMKIWEADKELPEENMQRDGSYIIKRSKGWGDQELVYPRQYYQKYCDGEELFEVLLQIEINKNKKVKTPIDFDKYYWGESLDISSQYLRQEYNKTIKESQIDLLPLQQELQKKYNAEYDKKVEKYNTLSMNLIKHNVFKHSEIVSPVNCNTIYNGLEKRSIDKFPVKDKVGKGKSLSDLITEVGLKSYEFGNKFTKRVTQIIKRISYKY